MSKIGSLVLLFVVKIFHLAAMALWFGAAFSTPADVRRTLASPGSDIPALLQRLRLTAKIMNGSGLATLITGLILVQLLGGFAAVPLRIHLGLALTLLIFVVGRWMIRPAVVELSKAAREPGFAAVAGRISRKFSRAVALEHGLRIVVLVLMVYPI
ncbi:MAG TPA: hypothetical protein VJR29_11470 [bacterium]|nr:hypothetical protein [bacterium]